MMPKPSFFFKGVIQILFQDYAFTVSLFGKQEVETDKTGKTLGTILWVFFPLLY